jgi:hypothetical protein
MIKNSELALISDEALDAVLAPRPAPAPRAPIPRGGPRRARRDTRVARADRTPDVTAP